MDKGAQVTKSFVLAVLAYLVPTFITGYVWHLVAFQDAYARLEIYRPDVVIPFGLGRPRVDSC